MNHKVLFAGVLVAAALLALYTPVADNADAKLNTEFGNWMKLHSKVYASEEERVYRFNRFRANYIAVQAHNARFAMGLETYDLEMNMFADLDRVEFKGLYLRYKKGVTSVCSGSVKEVTNPPASVDWSTKGAVQAVKNQGQCGSCWAFSAVGAIEGLVAIELGKLPNLSEQQIVDCATAAYGNEGCNGGEMDAAFWYVIDNGITSETQYKYTAKDGKCVYKSTMKVNGIANCAEVPANKTAWLVSAVAAQPVSIAVEADQIGFQLYRSGVFKGNCGTNLDHGITLVGYGNQSGQDYWKAKNSWGATWGSSGYILLAKGADGPGQCGIQMQNSVPLQAN